MRRFLSITLMLLLIVCLFVGCDEGKKLTSTDTNSKNNDTVTVSTADVVFLDENGESLYRIVRSENAVGDVTNCASLIFKQMKSKLGVNVKNVSDNDDGTDEYEILVGATNRPESAQGLQYLKSKTGGRYDDYIICTIGKKIVINAFSEKALNEACKYFVGNYLDI